ncbi:hypothetical protein PsorP6_003170 [Peronosclerospora sorghi]|uniref:Uncharacterized protein n=1 Tax=Peronosclerospora sorghi TaxID=230839 RepID=A0ACC0VP03_9STRA|nr:hypothetical protein PsorP6_003170 [Peronosclerospora sorghi]
MKCIVIAITAQTEPTVIDCDSRQQPLRTVVFDNAHDAVSIASVNEHILDEDNDNGDNQVDGNVCGQCEDAIDDTDQVIFENHKDEIVDAAHPMIYMATPSQSQPIII